MMPTFIRSSLSAIYEHFEAILSTIFLTRGAYLIMSSSRFVLFTVPVYNRFGKEFEASMIITNRLFMTYFLGNCKEAFTGLTARIELDKCLLLLDSFLYLFVLREVSQIFHGEIQKVLGRIAQFSEYLPCFVSTFDHVDETMILFSLCP